MIISPTIVFEIGKRIAPTRSRGPSPGTIRRRGVGTPAGIITLRDAALRIGLVASRLYELADLADRDLGLAKVEGLADHAAVLAIPIVTPPLTLRRSHLKLSCLNQHQHNAACLV